jgi:hypothetical protein
MEENEIKIKERIPKRERNLPITKKYGSSGASSDSGSSGLGFCSVGSNGNSSGGSGSSTVITQPYGGQGLYLKITQAGLDGFFSMGRFPTVVDDDGQTRTYSNITSMTLRYGIGSVYDGTSFDNAWNAAGSDYWSSSGNQSYWHWTPTLATGYTYTQLIRMTLTSPSGGPYTWNWYFWSGSVTLNTMSAPSGSFNSTTNDFTFTSYDSVSHHVLEFQKSGGVPAPYNAYSQETIDIFYNSAARDYEFGVYWGQAYGFPQSPPYYTFNLWDVGTYKVKLSYDPSHPSGTRTRYSNAVNSWISQTNSALSGSGISFVRDDATSSPDFLIETKSNSAMGSTSSYTYGGLWETTIDSNGWIYYAWVRLNYETQYFDGLWTTVEAITMEELYESMGCGGDLTTRADCINTDYNWYGKGSQYYNSIDLNIISLMYQTDLYLCVGGDSSELANEINPSNGFMATSGTVVDMFWLKPNTTYNYRCWQVNSVDSYSIVPSYSQTFTTGNYPQTPGDVLLDSVTPRVNGGFNLKWTAGSYCDYYQIAYRLDGSSTWNTIDYIYGLTYQITGLTGGTKYWFKIRGRSSYDKPSSGYTGENAATTAPKTPTGITIGTKTTYTIALTATGLTGNYSAVEWRYRVYGSGSGFSTSTDYGGSLSVTLTGLTPNTQYEIQCWSYHGTTGFYSASSYNISPYTNALPTPSLPSNISFTQSGYTQYVNISFTKGTNQNYTDIDMSSDGVNWGSIDWVHQANTSYSLDTGYYGLHYFRLRSVNDDGLGNVVYSAWSSTYNVNFTDRPNNWYWTTSISSGGNIYSTNLVTKTLYPLTATEWNNFTTKINAFRVYKGLGNASFTTVGSETVFTKEIFNEARNALNGLSAYFTGGNTIPPAMNTGDPILVASYYLNMRDALNSIT